MALGAGMVLLFLVAVYRRGKQSNSYVIEEVLEEEQTKLDDDAEDLDIPAPVVEEDNLDDDLELLD